MSPRSVRCAVTGLENRVRAILAAGIALAPADVPPMVVGTAA